MGLNRLLGRKKHHHNPPPPPPPASNPVVQQLIKESNEQIAQHDENITEENSKQQKLKDDNNAHLAELEKMKEAKDKLEEDKNKIEAEMANKLNKRKSAVGFANDKKIEIKRSKSTVLLGQAGSGRTSLLLKIKETFEKKSSLSSSQAATNDDDYTTTELTFSTSGKYLDTMKIHWTIESVEKLFMLFLYHGIPQDLILVFINDRINQATAVLSQFGVINSMVVIFKNLNEIWNEDDESEMSDDIDMKEKKKKELYNLNAYESIVNAGCAIKPVTHFDDLDNISFQRRAAGIDPFLKFFSDIGSASTSTFTVQVEEKDNNPLVEKLFRYIFIFEKKYKKNQFEFMKNAKLEEFDTID